METFPSTEDQITTDDGERAARMQGWDERDTPEAFDVDCDPRFQGGTD